MGKKLEDALTLISMIFLILTLPLSVWFCFRVLREYERAVVFRLGRLQRPARGPGLIFILPCTDNFIIIDLRVVTLAIPSQEILTKDSVTIRVDACVYFKVEDPILCYLKIKDFASATNLLSATSLRDQLGTLELTQVLSDREAISLTLQIILDEATRPWGVIVQRVEIKDVSLPSSMQRVMAAEGEAIREAKAKVIAAQGELNAAMSLKDASDIIASNPAALQLRYLQTLNTIAVEHNETIVFPLPIDILQMFAPKFVQCGHVLPSALPPTSPCSELCKLGCATPSSPTALREEAKPLLVNPSDTSNLSLPVKSLRPSLSVSEGLLVEPNEVSEATCAEVCKVKCKALCEAMPPKSLTASQGAEPLESVPEEVVGSMPTSIPTGLPKIPIETGTVEAVSKSSAVSKKGLRSGRDSSTLQNKALLSFSSESSPNSSVMEAAQPLESLDTIPLTSLKGCAALRTQMTANATSPVKPSAGSKPVFDTSSTSSSKTSESPNMKKKTKHECSSSRSTKS